MDEKLKERMKILQDKYTDKEVYDYFAYVFTIFNEVMSDEYFQKSIKQFDTIINLIKEKENE